ncbi:hypothetical protein PAPPERLAPAPP_00680 [Brevundimonas phage vB_BpoS-Papperlapapp]|uniref:Uncharacterized protein n=1 Tax=Brevundimonas phage vB_BpoS-Domovoi TaxID=2948598 RepID=A0A9E7SKJ5_9CAUD|nr:hypothetical protein DOMOVOI_05450 [Brevundimonas phage vB_BpoS-Domovoi]USN15810.1 hypothetical protein PAPPERLAPAPP_00680 [Brevundimonas phage vB_BpoS-Papperlapapp]
MTDIFAQVEREIASDRYARGGVPGLRPDQALVIGSGDQAVLVDNLRHEPDATITAAPPIKPKAPELARMVIAAAVDAGVAVKDLIEAILVQAEVSAPVSYSHTTPPFEGSVCRYDASDQSQRTAPSYPA